MITSRGAPRKSQTYVDTAAVERDEERRLQARTANIVSLHCGHCGHVLDHVAMRFESRGRGATALGLTAGGSRRPPPGQPRALPMTEDPQRGPHPSPWTRRLKWRCRGCRREHIALNERLALAALHVLANGLTPRLQLGDGSWSLAHPEVQPARVPDRYLTTTAPPPSAPVPDLSLELFGIDPNG